MILRRRASSTLRPLAVGLALVLSGGCATIPVSGQEPRPPITRGRPVAVVDFLGNVFALPAKLLLFHWKVDNHAISDRTEVRLIDYLDTPQSVAGGTHFSLNEYAPGRALKRLATNRKVAWPYRLLIGLPVTLLVDVLLPGRLFGGLIGGDMYNPYTDTVAIYSDLPSVAIHEAGHAHDFNTRRYKGTYSLLRLIPFVDLYQEYTATDEAVTHFVETGLREEELAAYKILYPAYGSYAGAYLLFPGSSVAGALVGHVWGRAKARSRRAYYEQRDAAQQQAVGSALPATP